MGHLFFYLFLQTTFLARCHYPSGPRVGSLVAIRNQPRFLKPQKEWDRKGDDRKGGRKGGYSRGRWEGKSGIQRRFAKREKKKKQEGMRFQENRRKPKEGGAVERVRGVFMIV